MFIKDINANHGSIFPLVLADLGGPGSYKQDIEYWDRSSTCKIELVASMKKLVMRSADIHQC